MTVSRFDCIDLLMRYLALFALFASLLFTGCETLPLRTKYDQQAHRPKNPDKVRVKVSLSKQMIYVLEGNRPLLVTAACVGTPANPTPKGNFEVYLKIRNKRSGSYGFAAKGNQIIGTTRGKVPSGWSYVGYPMPFWVEFAPAYGFHLGWVHPIPKSHGCIRLHANDASDFFALVKIGTPVNIATTQPEDQTLGKEHRRPMDYNDPDPPLTHMISKQYFDNLPPPHLVD
ncbi:MAG TPA: L,D-transpeptidase [Chthoniobacterales bacterium]